MITSIDSTESCPTCGGDVTYDGDEIAFCAQCGLKVDAYIDEFDDEERTDEIDEYDFIAEAD
jgi:predicted amidophosphoribosyltransferase